MIKLIVTDMDGTLLSDDKSIPTDFWEVEEMLARQGTLFAVASGRQIHSLQRRMSRIKDRTIFIAENGTLVIYKGDEIFMNPLDRETANRFIASAKSIKGAYPLLCGRKSAYTECKDERILGIIVEYFRELQVVDDLSRVNDIVLKVSVYDDMEVKDNTYPILSLFEGEVRLAIGGKFWLDLSNPSANKGTAVNHIQELMGISPEETLVFGDYLNDLEMMSVAKHSYAMRNAHPDLIKAANYVTAFDNNQNGVVETIRMLLSGTNHSTKPEITI